jgi:dihydroorotate dehydrogenase
MIRKIYKISEGKVPIIGVGGIFSVDDAWDKITAGASLIQVYTGLVFEGPGIARNIVSGLKKRVKEAGLNSISEAVGINS